MKLAIAGLAAAAAFYSVRHRRRISFAGKNVMISGASRGLGLDLARAFAAEKANVMLLARDEQRLAKAAAELQRYGTRISVVPCDVTRREQVKSAVETTVRQFGRMDVLINNAGTIQVARPKAWSSRIMPALWQSISGHLST